MLGISSVTRRSGLLVAIGLKMLRTVSGASGLGSNRSMCAGAPQLKIMMTDFALLFLRDGAASAASQWPDRAVRAAGMEPSAWRRVRSMAGSPHGGGAGR